MKYIVHKSVTSEGLEECQHKLFEPNKIDKFERLEPKNCHNYYGLLNCFTNEVPASNDANHVWRVSSRGNSSQQITTTTTDTAATAITTIANYTNNNNNNQSINQSTGLFVWQLKSWTETCRRLELYRNCTLHRR